MITSKILKNLIYLHFLDQFELLIFLFFQDNFVYENLMPVHLFICQLTCSNPLFGIFLQKMKNSTIQLLHLGKKRKVQKLQYSKLRTYNKIKTSRPIDAETSRTQSTSRTYEQCSITTEKLLDVIDCLKKDSRCLSEENSKLAKYIKKNEKIQRIILKKFPCIQYDSQDSESENFVGWETSRYENNCQSLLELKLSLEVVELESQLEQKAGEHRRLENNKRTSNQQRTEEDLFEQKTRFLNNFFNRKQIKSKAEVLSQEKNQIDELLEKVYLKQRKNKQFKMNSVKNLQILKYEIKDLEKSAEERKRRIRKGSCEYIEIQNGQMRNQQDILKELKEIQEKIKIQSQQLQVFLEEKMLEKISLINEIEKYQPTCAQLVVRGNKNDEKVRQSIKII